MVSGMVCGEKLFLPFVRKFLCSVVSKFDYYQRWEVGWQAGSLFVMKLLSQVILWPDYKILCNPPQTRVLESRGLISHVRQHKVLFSPS